MTYSPKGRWLTVGAGSLLVGIWFVTVRLGHWTMMARGVSLIAVVIIFGALGGKAFFFMDEIQKQERMREWYFGSMSGFLTAVITMICIRMVPAPFLAWLHSTPIHIVSLDQALIVGLAGGVALTLAMQALGAFLARAIIAIRLRT